MGSPIAKLGDHLVGVDTHLVLQPVPGGTAIMPVRLPFKGTVTLQVALSVFVDNMPVALEGSMGFNEPPHAPVGGPFVQQPHNMGMIKSGSANVYVHNRPVARHGDPATLCNDPKDLDNGVVVARGTVFAQ